MDQGYRAGRDSPIFALRAAKSRIWIGRRAHEENLRKNEGWLATMVDQLTGSVPKIRGFYRDEDGVFRLIGFGSGS